MVAATMNRDVSKTALLTYPELYRSGHTNEEFNLNKIGNYIYI